MRELPERALAARILLFFDGDDLALRLDGGDPRVEPREAAVVRLDLPRERGRVRAPPAQRLRFRLVRKAALPQAGGERLRRLGALPFPRGGVRLLPRLFQLRRADALVEAARPFVPLLFGGRYGLLLLL